MTPPKALEMIGIELQKQYEKWQPKARYKHCLDPTSDDVKKLCISLRKNAKVIRLFHIIFVFPLGLAEVKVFFTHYVIMEY